MNRKTGDIFVHSSEESFYNNITFCILYLMTNLRVKKMEDGLVFVFNGLGNPTKSMVVLKLLFYPLRKPL